MAVNPKALMIAVLAIIILLAFVPAATILFPTTLQDRTRNLPAGGDSEGVQNLYLYIEEDELGELYGRPDRDGVSVNGTVRLAPDDEDIEYKELRFRGSSSLFLEKRSFRIVFKEPQEMLFGSNTMELKATFTDPTMMREKLSMDMFAELGQPAPGTKFFDLYINDVYEGLYIHVERIDAHMLERNGLNPNGTLVADDFRGSQYVPGVDRLSVFGFNLSGVEDPESFLESTMSARTDVDWREVRSLVEWVYNTSAGNAFEEGFRERFNVTNFIDWLAVHYLIGDIDSFGDDYWLYLDTGDPTARWTAIPWDKDLTFGSHTRAVSTDNDYFAYEYPVDAPLWQNDLIAKFLETPGLRSQFDGRMEHLMAEVFTPEYFTSKVGELEPLLWDSLNIRPGEKAFVLHPQNHHGEIGFLPFHSEAILDFVELRYQFLNRTMTPAYGEAYTAVAEIRQGDEGRKVFFTDPNGWVMASIAVHQVVVPGNISVEVMELEGNPGIEREWRFGTAGAEIIGNLTLYYRNDVVSWAGEEDVNWFVSEAPVKDDLYSQWDLRIVEWNGSAPIVLPTYVNPFSDKVSADIALRGDVRLTVELAPSA